MENEWAFQIKLRDLGNLRARKRRRLFSVRVIHPMVDQEQLRPPIALANEALRVAERCRGSAGNRGRLAQTGDDPALQIFAGKRGGTIGRFPERAANRQQIVAGDNNRARFDVRAIHRVRMIANVDEIDAGGEFSPQLSREKNKFVEITEPLRDEAARDPDPAEKRLGVDQLGRYPGLRQTAEHHHRETLHALLLIGWVVTDQ